MRKLFALLIGLFWITSLALGADTNVPAYRILPEDVVQSSIKVTTIGLPTTVSNSFAVLWTYTEKGASNNLAFWETHAGEQVRITAGDYLSPVCRDGRQARADYGQWREGWLKWRTDKFYGVTKADAEAIAAGLREEAPTGESTSEGTDTAAHAQTNVTGVVLDQEGKAIPGVRYSVFGWSTPSGGHIGYSGVPLSQLTDKEGKFAIPYTRPGGLLDIQFDEDGGHFVVTNGVSRRVPPFMHAPTFVYKFKPADSPLTVVMTEGKVLKGRIVEKVKDQLVPITQAEIELQMGQEGMWYQNKQHTDSKGEFQFRISEPPAKHNWLLYYGGKRFPIDYRQITADTVVEIDAAITIGVKAEHESTSPTSQQP